MEHPLSHFPYGGLVGSITVEMPQAELKSVETVCVERAQAQPLESE
jgi:hypothetical protein